MSVVQNPSDPVLNNPAVRDPEPREAIVREVTSVDGTRIVYRASGNQAGRPLILLHGWAQSGACWGEALLAELGRKYRVVAVDLRGHGYSGAPEIGYDEPANWAGDVSAVLAGEGVVSGAVLLGWSYGGLVITDYVSVHGTAALAGVVLVGAITSIGRGEAGGRVGKSMRDAIPGAMSEDPRIAIRALSSFGQALTGPVTEDSPVEIGALSQALFGASLSTRPRVRAALFDRAVSHDDVLEGLDVPALIVHGTHDSVVDVAAGQHAAALIPDVRTSFWDGVDHGPFVANPARFAGEVGEFLDSLDGA